MSGQPITDEQIRTKARQIVLDDITDQVHDEMGLSEQLDDEIHDLAGDEQDAVVERLKTALGDVRDGLEKLWGLEA
jgi:hypothetical protein